MSKQNNMAMVLQALKNAGLSDNQARILGAEIGRENAFQDKYLWGYHPDPKNGAVNIGIISWQGSRGKGVENALRSAGLIKNGQIIKGQASLDVMAKYLVDEIRTNPTYSATRKQFLDNPEVDYHTGTKVLGTNFIRWRYNDPKYASGHRNRDNFYRQLGGITPTGGDATQETQFAGGEQTAPDSTNYLNQLANFQAPQQQFQTSATQPQQEQGVTDIFGMSGNGNLLGLNFDLMTALQGMNQQPQTAMLPTPFGG